MLSERIMKHYENLIAISQEIWDSFKKYSMLLKSPEVDMDNLISMNEKIAGLLNVFHSEIIKQFPELENLVALLLSDFNEFFKSATEQEISTIQNFIRLCRKYMEILTHVDFIDSYLNAIWILKNEKEFFELKSSSSDFEYFIKQLNEKNGRIKRLRNEVIKLRNENDRLLNKIRIIENDNKHLSIELREIYTKYDNILSKVKEIKKLKAQNKFLLEIIEEKNKEIELLKKDVSDSKIKWEAEINYLRQEIKNLKEELEKCKAKLTDNAFKSVVNSIKYLREYIRRIESENRKLKEALMKK